ncbi:MAG TPA: SGNH/GDSL hydrolase family protein, partial [Thermodesulfobacteriota bacterium]|nr:SGNH/GDSL hydrolase family protein [Thermodesulfobacteriota bacterium]
ALNQAHRVKIDVEGTKILVYLDNEPLFSASDASISSGTVALFAQRSARFDNVLIGTNSSTPKVVITRPTSYFVKTSNTLPVSAVARNVPAGGGVKFILDNGVFSFTDFTEPYSGQFSNLSRGDHIVKAIIVNSSGNPIFNSTNLDEDTNKVVGTSGKYLVAIGDSITNGVGDDFAADNESVDGRNLSWGYTPILNDLLSAQLSKPVIIVNEGIPGTKSGAGGGNGVSIVNSTKARHTESKQWLILYGTNDSGGTMPVPSGKNCTEAQLQAGDPSCTGTYKANMRNIIKKLKGFNKVPVLAKVPYVKNATVSRDKLIQDYNTVINQLVTEHNIGVKPPDFYTYFKNHQGEYADTLHPNGNGYISMANLWSDALINSRILNP